MRRPKPDRPATWAECIAGAVGVFAMMTLAYAVIPHEWITFSDKYLQWDTTQFVFRSGQDVFGLGIVNWPFNFDKHVIRDIIVLGIYGLGVGLNLALIVMWQKRGEVKEPAPDAPAKTSRFGRPLRRKARARARHRGCRRERWRRLMARTDANPPMPDFATDYELQEVDPSYLTASVKPKQFLHIDQAECILCEGCVDICPWKCIHMVSVSAISDAVNTEQPGEDPRDHVAFIVDEDICTRCALCVDRCPTGVIILGKLSPDIADGDRHVRTPRNGYAYGVRF